MSTIKFLIGVFYLPHRNQRHDGDFGNLRQTNNGIIDTTFAVQNLQLTGERGILGRSLVVRAFYVQIIRYYNYYFL